MTDAERLDIDAGLVARLIAAQLPRWAHLPVRPVELSGWDNRTLRLGDRLSVRLPSASWYALQVEKEQRWLPVLAPRLPLPIPTWRKGSIARCLSFVVLAAFGCVLIGLLLNAHVDVA